MPEPFPVDDLHDVPPPFWRRRADGVWAVLVFVLTAGLTVVAFPPFQLPEAAYVLAAPAALWAYRRPGFRLFAATVLGAQMVAWTVILGWLHHVTWGGLLLLGPFIGLWVGSWFLGAWSLLPRLPGRPAVVRVFAMFGLAGAWVVVEWSRTWVLTGFPWLPLAASQWQRVSILQIASYTGAGGVAFVLVAMNLGFAAYAHRLFFEDAKGIARRSQEFLAAMFLLLVCLTVHVREAFNRGRYAVPLARVALVQPYIPQAAKWDPTQDQAILKVLEQTTLDAAGAQPELILWPEATTPWAVKGDDLARAFVESLAQRARAPLLLGSIVIERGGASGEPWYNAALVVDPATGLASEYYAKRHLVPFGEYVPWRPLFGWLKKFVEVGDNDCSPGTAPVPLTVRLRRGPLVVGPLVCYEDLFPDLARSSARAGAEVLTVLTNDAWYGEGGAAYQHAAGAVLRAIETRRPVLRCGNGGWSGWIDEFGSVRAVLTRDAAGKISTDPTAAGTIYFRGGATVDVTRDSRWIGQQSFYTEHGEWFVVFSAALATLAALALRGSLPPVGAAGKPKATE